MRPLVLGTALVVACSAGRPLDGRLEPAVAGRAAMHELGEDVARIELLADGELLVDGRPFAGGVERRTWITERLASVPRVPIDEDAPEWLVLSPIELWVDGRTPYWRVQELLDDLTYQSAPATRLRLGVRDAAGKLGWLRARLPLVTGCRADEMDVFVLEIGAQPAVRLWGGEWTDEPAVRHEQEFSDVAQLSVFLAGREDGPSARTVMNHLEADAEATWQQAIDACSALALREAEVWLQPIEQR